ncbi:YbhB/YbcL family Raf kinase inhibitor-like protein [Flavobacterium columnare]|nr:YbhB/YbcL family Raf kinase inhibitor-like protein [Flavobacterium columnare]QOG93737.1 YbhB/YbcL family Raf kinase inhibitor-like protein [Flavobacterium columnare]QOG96404.1 YbhB/YbcL family Raf kinase inhibitor-like protein [Flavobacterium columnare]QOG99063.1 YbhB/YbcL family Raf kinase inhibitor-like protein [Flavobacterium columnare]QOH01722.1 YbhB/YbcL family Raf kinase inhibitor-like protein [Flavobacterium columnare]
MKMKKILTLLAFISAFTASAQTFTLKSNDLGGQATMKQVFNGFGCTGENMSPQLFWENAPKDTKSFAVTIHDENAPTGSGWWHWLAFDIPATTKELKTGAGDVTKNLMPAGSIQSITDFGKSGYGGPCPPEGHGFHKYTITVYALKTDKLGLDKNASPALVGYYLNGNTIEKASIVMYYKR